MGPFSRIHNVRGRSAIRCAAAGEVNVEAGSAGRVSLPACVLEMETRPASNCDRAMSGLLSREWRSCPENRWENVNLCGIGSCVLGNRKHPVHVAGQLVAPASRSVAVTCLLPMSSICKKTGFLASLSDTGAGRDIQRRNTRERGTVGNVTIKAPDGLGGPSYGNRAALPADWLA